MKTATAALYGGTYSHPAWSQTEKLLRRAVADLRSRKVMNIADTIVVRGTSGITFGTLLAKRLGMNLLIVRKPGEQSHASTDGLLQGAAGKRGWIFVDDLVASGSTFRGVCDAMSDCHDLAGKFRGVLLYNDHDHSKFHDRDETAEYCGRLQEGV